MELNKDQIEAVRYQVKKKNLKASNEEIRLAARDFTDFNASEISDKVSSNKGTLAFSDDLENTPPTDLVLSQKQEKIITQSVQMGITLTQSEITQIAQSIDFEIDDTVNTLIAIRDLIKGFLANRRDIFDRKTKEVMSEIGEILKDNDRDMSGIRSDVQATLSDVGTFLQSRKGTAAADNKSLLGSFQSILG